MWTSMKRRAVEYLVASQAYNSFAFQSVVISSRSLWLSRDHSTTGSYSASSIKMVKQVYNRVALLQVPVTESKLMNLKTARDYVKRAYDAGAKLTVLPEIWNSPYATSAFADYAEMLPNVGDQLMEEVPSNDGEISEVGDDVADDGWGPSSRLLMTLAKQYNMYIVGGSIPEQCDNKIYNTCLIINPDGEVVGKHRKVHLFDVDVPGGICFKESETLTAGDSLTYFDVEGLARVGVGICYDIRFPELAMVLTQNYNCKILIYPGAFNLTTGPAHWELLQRARAVDGQCYVLAASPARTSPSNDDGDDETDVDGTKKKYPHYSAWGHSTVVSPWGEVVATCDEKPALVVTDLDMRKVEEMRMAIPTMRQKRNDLYRLVDG
jgi:omega-amidase